MNSRNKQSRVTPKIAICMKYRRKLEYSDIYWKNHILQKLKTKNNWDEGKQFSRKKLKHSEFWSSLAPTWCWKSLAKNDILWKHNYFQLLNGFGKDTLRFLNRHQRVFVTKWSDLRPPCELPWSETAKIYRSFLEATF